MTSIREKIAELIAGKTFDSEYQLGQKRERIKHAIMQYEFNRLLIVAAQVAREGEESFRASVAEQWDERWLPAVMETFEELEPWIALEREKGYPEEYLYINTLISIVGAAQRTVCEAYPPTPPDAWKAALEKVTA